VLGHESSGDEEAFHDALAGSLEPPNLYRS